MRDYIRIPDFFMVNGVVTAIYDISLLSFWPAHERVNPLVSQLVITDYRNAVSRVLAVTDSDIETPFRQIIKAGWLVVGIFTKTQHNVLTYAQGFVYTPETYSEDMPTNMWFLLNFYQNLIDQLIPVETWLKSYDALSNFYINQFKYIVSYEGLTLKRDQEAVFIHDDVSARFRENNRYELFMVDAKPDTNWIEDNNVFELLYGMNVTSVHITVDLNEFQNNPASYDEAIEMLHDNGYRIIATFDFDPVVTDSSTFVDNVNNIVGRYKNKIRVWEFMSEPDTRGLMPGTYVAWLYPFYYTVKSIDPNIEVIAYGGTDCSGYYTSVYQYGGRLVSDSFSLRLHPFEAKCVEELKQFLDDAGDTHKKVWITSYGLCSNNQKEQAEGTKTALDWSIGHDYVMGMSAHLLDESSNCGLIKDNGKPKKAFHVFAQKSAEYMLDRTGHYEHHMDVENSAANLFTKRPFEIFVQAKDYLPVLNCTDYIDNDLQGAQFNWRVRNDVACILNDGYGQFYVCLWFWESPEEYYIEGLKDSHKFENREELGKFKCVNVCENPEKHEVGDCPPIMCREHLDQINEDPYYKQCCTHWPGDVGYNSDPGYGEVYGGNDWCGYDPNAENFPPDQRCKEQTYCSGDRYVDREMGEICDPRNVFGASTNSCPVAPTVEDAQEKGCGNMCLPIGKERFCMGTCDNEAACNAACVTTCSERLVEEGGGDATWDEVNQAYGGAECSWNCHDNAANYDGHANFGVSEPDCENNGFDCFNENGCACFNPPCGSEGNTKTTPCCKSYVGGTCVEWGTETCTCTCTGWNCGSCQ
jgi:hypothetical protein